MLLRVPVEAKLSIDMTPMIDIVFQLPVFFVMTLNIAQTEGDFQLLMPAHGGVSIADPFRVVLPLRVQLLAHADGSLAEILLEGSSVGKPTGPGEQRRWSGLRRQLIELLPDAASREAAEIVFETDAGLQYQHLVDGITAVSGYRNASGQWTTLIEKIKLSPAGEPVRVSPAEAGGE